ncbi:uncharacterized protein [Venturia canescens]|uniref:uncharacterized protein n=1 Tax=Venturia canescens TaxID=32260 RepID=UPI001C9BCC78|nr:uncharacterized protein LOC122413624 [Venturia canescens]
MARQDSLRSDLAIREAFQASNDGDPALDEASDGDDDEIENDSGSEAHRDEEFRPDELGAPVELKVELAQVKEKFSQRKRLKGIPGTAEPDQGCRLVSAKAGPEWRAKASGESRNPVSPCTSYLPAPIGEARNVSTSIEAWSLFFSSAILEKIQNHTNEEIRRYRGSIHADNASESTYMDVELKELKAFIGLMYFAGLQKAVKTNLEELWSNEYGSTFYRAAMSLKRFQFLARTLRFDDKTTRTHRSLEDKLAPIREIWEDFLTNCSKYYNPGFLCTAGEQLLSFRGQCPFKVQTSSERCGIKVFTLNDARTFYMLAAEPYTAKVTANNAQSKSSYYVKKLSRSIDGSWRNITCTNGLTCLELFDEMLENHSLTMLGVVRKSEAHIPENFSLPGALRSSIYAYDNAKTLLAYTLRRDKVVVLLSTYHRKEGIDEETGDPEMLTFYNSTKTGAAKFDEMCREYTTARKSLRWPMRLWMGMLDQAGINATIIYNLNSANRISDRRGFLKSLIFSLVEPHLRARLEIPYLHRDLRLSIQILLKIDLDPPVPKAHERTRGRRRCLFCPRSRDRKVSVFCDNCQRAICDDHKIISCLVCYTRA